MKYIFVHGLGQNASSWDGTINLCGLSLGGILALNYTIDNPSKVKSLILIGGQYKMPKLILSFQNVIFKCLPNKVFAKMGLSKNQIIQLTKSMLDLDFSTQIADVVCPTMIIYGEKDKANKKAAQELASAISEAQLEMIEGAGHEVNTQAPTQLGHIISKYV
ncbi:MAG: acyl-CoA thioester hydrolase/BAAT C-terminal domain-containing protein [Niameybacter sp.]